MDALDSNRSAIVDGLIGWLKRQPGELTIQVIHNGLTVAQFTAGALTPVTLNDPCKKAIYDTLAEIGHRLTTTELLTKMSQRGREYSDSWVKAKLSEMIEDGVIDNDQKARPRGYGLPVQ